MQQSQLRGTNCDKLNPFVIFSCFCNACFSLRFIKNCLQVSCACLTTKYFLVKDIWPLYTEYKMDVLNPIFNNKFSLLFAWIRRPYTEVRADFTFLINQISPKDEYQTIKSSFIKGLIHLYKCRM